MAPSGVQVIDDTFNSNPAGCAAALDTLGGLAAGRRVVVTPGMVELGPVQAAENERFAAHAAEVADDVVLVARTNRDALRRGAGRGRAALVEVDTREEAVAWVRATLRRATPCSTRTTSPTTTRSASGEIAAGRAPQRCRTRYQNREGGMPGPVRDRRPRWRP